MTDDLNRGWGDQIPVEDHDGTPAGMVSQQAGLAAARQLALEVYRNRQDVQAVHDAQQAMVREQAEATSVVNPLFAVFMSGALVTLTGMLEDLGVARSEIDTQVERILLPANDNR